jgi:ribosomal protein S18 acetylase RimI-like enzyme
MSTALMRIFTAVPAHASFGVIMGYYVGKAKFDYLKKQHLLLKGLFVATLAHGFYDCFLFLIQNEWIHRYISKAVADILLFAGAIASLVISVIFSRRLVRLHRRTSAQLYSTNSLLTIRHANAGDVEMIRALAMQIWPDTYAKILSPQQIRYMMNMMYSEQSLLSQMKSNHQFIIVYNTGVPIGFASYSEKAPTIYKLHKIYLKPKQQGRGSGKFIIEQIINDVKPKGAEILQLDVNRNNKAKGFYEKMGFEVVGEKNTDIGNGYLMEDYVMEKTL